MSLRTPPAPFWGSGPADGARLLLFGVPLELTVSGNPGTANGPPAVRRASHNIESYSPNLKGDLFDAGLADLGDLDLAGLGLEAALVEVERTTAELLDRGLPIMIGGEHTATLAAFRAVKRRHPDAGLISLDAHLDLADELDGERLAHGTWGARVGDEWGLDCLTLLGVRSGTRDEWRRARDCAWWSPDLVLPDDLRARLAGRPVYLSVDIDVLDPAAAPGTGCPEPGGPDSRELFRFLYGLDGLHLVGLDVMEVLPDVDPAGITAAVAAKLIREAAILFGRAG
jgi:agmatinase